MTIRSLLVSTDFSDASALAVKRAVEIAHAFDAKLHVVHVVEQIPVFLATRLEETESGKTPYEEHLVTEARRSLSACLSETPNCDGIEVERHFRAGFPPIEILDSLAAIEPDLLVMATHGRHGFSRAFLGSVAEKVVRGAPCPVLTCKLRDDADAMGEFRPERILYPIDLPEATLEGLDLAVEMALRYDSELHVVHVLRDFDAGFAWDEIPLAPGDFLDNWEAHCREKLQDLVSKRVPEEIKTDCHLRQGRPHRGILEYCSDHRCDLIVMPTHGRSGLSHALLGSVTERVVRLSSCPVLTVRGSG